jgi:hypothetical protein
MKELYFHEDDYCQIELVPVENKEFVRKQLGDINSFSEEHKSPDGYGWTDIYIRSSDTQITLKDYKIKRREFAGILPQFAVKYDKVFTGYSSSKRKCKNTAGYSIKGINIFCSYENKYITKIWFDFCLDKIDMAENLYDILKSITNEYDLLFVHWTWGYYSHVKRDFGLKNKLIEAYESYI